MKVLKLAWALCLLAVLVIAVQLVDPPPDSPATRFGRLAEPDLVKHAETAGIPAGLFLADYVIEQNLPRRADALALRATLLGQGSRLQVAGWSSWTAAGSQFENLAGNNVADSVLYGELADVARQMPDEAEISKARPLAGLFPPADGALTLFKLAGKSGALNENLSRQLKHVLEVVGADPKSAAAVEQCRENLMPLLELARRCRTWSEWQTIVAQADSPDQVRVLTKVAGTSASTPKRLSQVLVVAASDGRPAVAGAIDYVLRQGPAGLDMLHAALRKGAAGLKFVAEQPGLTAQTLRGGDAAAASWLIKMQRQYQGTRYEYGPVVSAGKYLFIAIVSGFLVLAIVPARYFGRLMSAGSPEVNDEPTPVYSIVSALAVGAVLSGLAYIFAIAMRASAEPVAAAVEGGVAGAAATVKSTDNALLSGAVVLLSLLAHAVIWFYVRGKLKNLEDDAASSPALRIRRLENMDVFLDLPLFCGLALTVIAFILITLDAGMSRHFAYTSTVVGILSSVSLRIRYQYPLKERLTQAITPRVL